MMKEGEQTFLGLVSGSKPRVRYVYFVGLLVFTMYCLFMGVFEMVENYKMARHIMASQRWEMTEGLILAARTRARDTRSKSEPSAASRLTYQYLVDNHIYASSSVSYHDKGNPSGRKSATQVYTAGTWVPVYYDPLNPQTAVLERGRIIDVYIPSLLAGIMICAGIVGFYYMLKVWGVIENDWHGAGW